MRLNTEGARNYNIYSNINFLTIIIALCYYMYVIFKKLPNTLKRNNELFYLGIIIIYIFITMLTSMYYHHCGGDLDENALCKFGKGYNITLVAKNDKLLSASALVFILLLLPRKFFGSSIKFFISMLMILYSIMVLSFTEIEANMLYANLFTLLIAVITSYFTFSDVRASKDPKKLIRVIMLILNLILFFAAIGVFMSSGKLFSLIKKGDDTVDDNIIRKQEVLHGTWHILISGSGVFLILYKIFDIININN